MNNKDTSEHYLYEQGIPNIAALSLSANPSTFSTTAGVGSDIAIPPALTVDNNEER